MTTNNPRYWHDDITMPSPGFPCQDAVRAAVEWLADRPGTPHVDLEERRSPSPEDLPDYTHAVIDAMRDWVIEEGDPDFADTNCPTMSFAPKSSEYAALRDAITAYVNAHTNVAGMAWSPTYRVLRVWCDGRHEIMDIEEAMPPLHELEQEHLGAQEGS